MIKREGSFEVQEEGAGLQELVSSVDGLPVGKYRFLIYDDKKNRSLPQLKYLFGVVLKTISENLPDHPPIDALYRYFEEVYAPLHVCDILGERFEYTDLKSEKSIELGNVIDSIIQHAAAKWHIKIPERDFLKLPSAAELYVDAYVEMWRDLPSNH